MSINIILLLSLIIVIVLIEHTAGRVPVTMGWISNFEGSLAIGNFNAKQTPTTAVYNEEITSVGIKQIVLNRFSQIVLLNNGKLYGAGLNQDGELNAGGSISATNRYVEALMTDCLASKNVTKVLASFKTVYAITSDGIICSYGSTANLQLGRSTTSTLARLPGDMSTGSVLEGKTVLKWAAGAYHVFLLMDDNNLYTWGANTNGALGLQTNAVLPTPLPMTAFGTSRIIDVCCGSFFTAVVSAEGEFFYWGQVLITTGTPTQVPVPANCMPVMLACGGGHVLITCSDGTVWGAGGNSYGQLGNGATGSTNTFVQTDLTPLEGRTVIQISATVSASYIVAEDGNGKRKFYSMGLLGESGNTEPIRNIPQPVYYDPLWTAEPEYITEYATDSKVGLYYCPDGYYGASCNISICHGKLATDPTSCSGKGDCIAPNTCLCDDGWFSSNCTEFGCFGYESTNTTWVCSGSGTCIGNNTCDCFTGFVGSSCAIPICYSINASAPSVCSGHGLCGSPDNCTCDFGYYGEQCEMDITCFGFNATDSNACSGYGLCTGIDVCECIDGYTGEECSLPICWGIAANDSLVCSQHGSCIAPNSCECTAYGYEGLNCSEAVCFGLSSNESCSGYGECIEPDICDCIYGTTGAQCEYFVCFGQNSSSPDVCSAHGNCLDIDACTCGEGYTGSRCELLICNSKNQSDPLVCSGNGICTGPDVCSCLSTHVGVDCSIETSFELTYDTLHGVCSNVTITAIIMNGFILQWSSINQTSEELEQYLASQVNQSQLIVPYSYLNYGTTYQLLFTAIYGDVVLNETIQFSVSDFSPQVNLTSSYADNTYFRRDVIAFSAELSSIPICLDADPSYEWSVSSSNIASNSSAITIPEFTFTNEGTYTLSLTVVVFGKVIEKSATFHIILNPAVAVIRGGNNVMRYGVVEILDASLSYDPEYPTFPVNYTWACYNSTNQTCSEFNNSGSAIQEFTGYQTGTYYISLVIANAYGRTSNSSVTIVVKENDLILPKIEITTKLALTTGRSQKISLFATATPFSQVVVMWNVTVLGSTENLLDQMDPSIILSRRGTRSLILRENSLSPGVTYLFTFFARYRNQTEYARSVVSTTISNGITKGTFEISPESGFILRTNFHLVVQNWTDSSNSLAPLLYAFDYWDQVSGTFKLLQAFSTSSNITTSLFSTVAGNTTIRCRARNSFGDVAIMNAFVQLEQTPQNVTELLQLIISKKDEVQQTQTLTPDVGFSLVAAATVSTDFNSLVVDAILQLMNLTNSLSGDGTLKDQIQTQYSIVLEILSQFWGELTELQRSNALQLLSSILRTQSQYDPEVAQNTIQILKRLSQRIDTNDILTDLSNYCLQSLIPGEQPLSLNSANLSILVQKNYASDIEDTVLSSDNNRSSVVVPSIPILLSNGTDTVFSLEYISYSNPADLSFWEADSTNLTTSVLSFTILDANGSKVPIATQENEPLVIIISKLDNEIRMEDGYSTVCKYIESATDSQWQSDGCELFEVTETQVVCHCNHTTSFAAFIEYTEQDVLKPISSVAQSVYIIQIVFSSLYILIILSILTFLIIQRNKQPIRSRLLAPYFCLTALLVELALSGIVRNSLILSHSSFIAINSIGKVILIVCNPLAIVSLFILFWQQLRYIVLRRVHEIMASLKSSSIVLSVGKILTSQWVFVAMGIAVYGSSLVYYIVFSAISISQSKRLNETRATYLTLVSAVSYASTMIVLCICIVLAFLWDSVIIPLQTLKRDKYNQIEPEESAVSSTDSVSTEEERKNKIEELQKVKNLIPLRSQLHKHFIYEDPLYFRMDTIFLLASVICGLISFAISISNRYIAKNDDSPVMIAWLIFDLLYTFLRIIAFGGCVATVRAIVIVKRQRDGSFMAELEGMTKIEENNDAVNIVLSVLRNKYGYKLIQEYAVKEFSTENLLVWSELDTLLPMAWLELPVDKKRELMDMLLSKYLKPGSPFEINIPATLRRSLVALQKTGIETQPPQDQLVILKNLYNQILINVSDTFSRFTETPEYVKYVQASLIHNALQDVIHLDEK